MCSLSTLVLSPACLFLNVQVELVWKGEVLRVEFLLYKAQMILYFKCLSFASATQLYNKSNISAFDFGRVQYLDNQLSTIIILSLVST